MQLSTRPTAFLDLVPVTFAAPFPCSHSAPSSTPRSIMNKDLGCSTRSRSQREAADTCRQKLYEFAADLLQTRAGFVSQYKGTRRRNVSSALGCAGTQKSNRTSYKQHHVPNTPQNVPRETCAVSTRRTALQQEVESAAHPALEPRETDAAAIDNDLKYNLALERPRRFCIVPSRLSDHVIEPPGTEGAVAQVLHDLSIKAVFESKQTSEQKERQEMCLAAQTLSMMRSKETSTT